MKRQIAFALLACASAASFATDLLIDDFTTGQYASPQLKSTYTNQQTGSMQGGTRTVSMTLCTGSTCPANNPFVDTASFKITTSKDKTHPYSAFIQNAGFEVYPRTVIDYGDTPGSMSLDLSGDDRLRFSFLGLTGPFNFNVQVFDQNNLYMQGGCNFPAYNASFALELPFSAFLQPGGAIDLKHVTHIAVIIQGDVVIGGYQFALSNFSVSNTTQSGALTCAYTS